MGMQHTPGPWVVNPLSAQVDCTAPSKLGGLLPVARMLWPTDERSEAETGANALLIAGAPELLDVARRGLRCMERELETLLESVCLLDKHLKPRRDTIDPEFSEEAAELERAISDARAAIAKATGK